MPFDVDTPVAIRTLGNRRGIVVASEGRERYRVRVEGIVVTCREEDLAAIAEATRKGTRKKRQEARAAADAPQAEDGRRPAGEPAGRTARVDLHGMRVEEALSRVDDEINRALLDGEDRLEVVHGRGSGRIREALHRHLASMTVVAAFRLDARNPGVTWVHF